MIFKYGFSLIGSAHLKSSIVCQDAHYIVINNDEVSIAAVADGLGSEIHSDISSKIVSEKAVNYCSERIHANTSQNIIEIIKESFESSWREVEKYVNEKNDDILQYDTTLTLCVLIDGNLYYGHSGDGGIIAMTCDGRFITPTKQQRDEEGHVFPLCFGDEFWKFGKVDEKVVSVLLATDGVYELFFPIYIRDKEISTYNALIRFFIDPYPYTLDEVNTDELIGRRRDYLYNLPENVVSDDKTVVALIDAGIPLRYQDDSYYIEPDWEFLIAEWRRRYNESAYREKYDNE